MSASLAISWWLARAMQTPTISSIITIWISHASSWYSVDCQTHELGTVAPETIIQARRGITPGRIIFLVPYHSFASNEAQHSLGLELHNGRWTKNGIHDTINGLPQERDMRTPSTESPKSITPQVSANLNFFWLILSRAREMVTGSKDYKASSTATQVAGWELKPLIYSALCMIGWRRCSSLATLRLQVPPRTVEGCAWYGHTRRMACPQLFSGSALQHTAFLSSAQPSQISRTGWGVYTARISSIKYRRWNTYIWAASESGQSTTCRTSQY